MNKKYSELMGKAMRMATRKHDGQYRKTTGLPYVLHCTFVANMISKTMKVKYRNSRVASELICAALLHDVVEDTCVTVAHLKDIFGEQIAGYVSELTYVAKSTYVDPAVTDRLVSKEQYLENIAENGSNTAVFVKICDRVANLMDMEHEGNPKLHAYARQALPLARLPKHRINQIVSELDLEELSFFELINYINEIAEDSNAATE